MCIYMPFFFLFHFIIWITSDYGHRVHIQIICNQYMYWLYKGVHINILLDAQSSYDLHHEPVVRYEISISCRCFFSFLDHRQEFTPLSVCFCLLFVVFVCFLFLSLFLFFFLFCFWCFCSFFCLLFFFTWNVIH
jgi:hypothetical protein